MLLPLKCFPQTSTDICPWGLRNPGSILRVSYCLWFLYIRKGYITSDQSQAKDRQRVAEDLAGTETIICPQTRKGRWGSCPLTALN